MLVLEMVDKLKRLGDKVSLSSSDKSDIELMFHEVLGRTFTKTSCGDCYRDAVIEMYSYLKRYGKMKEKELINKVIGALSQQVKDYATWASESENQEWDFSKFFEFPFIKDGKGNYISVCDITLRNAFFEKIFWLIRDCYPKDDSRAMAFFGRLFEKYIQNLTQEATKGSYSYIEEFAYGKNNKKSSYYSWLSGRLSANKIYV